MRMPQAVLMTAVHDESKQLHVSSKDEAETVNVRNGFTYPMITVETQTVPESDTVDRDVVDLTDSDGGEDWEASFKRLKWSCDSFDVTVIKTLKAFATLRVKN
ncbi:hypothetical protein HK101_005081, partial [Irineochytrium annulatum]